MRQVSLKKERSEGNTTAIFKYSKEEWLVLLSSTTRKKGNMLQETTFQFIIKKNFLAFLACNSVYYSSDLKKKKVSLATLNKQIHLVPLCDRNAVEGILH